MVGKISATNSVLKKLIVGVAVVLAAELIYLVVANILINTSLGPRIATRHPQKLDVKWESGYSLYPGHTVLYGFSMRFQKNRNKWMLTADRLAGHIGLERLIWRHFHVPEVEARGVSYRYIRLAEPIPDPAPDRPHWLITIDSFDIRSIHMVAANDFSLVGSGNATGSLRYVTRRELQVLPSELHITEGILSRGDTTLAGSVDLQVRFLTEPFIPSVEKGRQALRHVKAELTFTAETEMLQKPLALFRKLPWLEIRKSGRLTADLRFEQGVFLAGSKLGISDMEIRSRYRDLLVRGTGSVYAILADPVQDFDDIRRANLEIQFRQFQLERDGLSVPLVNGTGFRVLLESEQVNLNQGKTLPGFNMTIDMPRSNVPDVTALNSYFDKWEMFAFEHGGAQISATMNYDHEKGKGQGEISLSSDRLGILIQNHSLDGSFDFHTAFHEFDPSDPGFRFSAQLKLKNPDQSWYFDTDLTEGVLEWPIPYLEMGGNKVLSEASGSCKLGGEVSDIGFLNAFLKGQHGLQLNGPATLDGTLILKKGKPAERTLFRFDVPAIKARFLGYVAEGNASLTAAVHETGKRNTRYRADLGLVIRDYRVRLQGMNGIHSGGKILQADMQIPSLKLDGSAPSVELQIKMPENTIYDMRTYNQLWGDEAPFQIVKGNGKSRGTFTFSGENQSMEGQITLNAPETKVVFDAIPITADLKFEGKLISENVEEKKFNLAGSRLRLDHVYVGAADPGDDWQLMCQLGNTEIHWEKPLRISGEASMTMTDSAPIVSYFVEQHDFLKYFSGLFNVKDIRGRTGFRLDENFLDVKKLQIFGDVLRIDGKLRMNREFKKGALLVRFHKVPLLVTMENGRKQPHLFGAQKKFDAFRVFSETDSGDQKPERK